MSMQTQPIAMAHRQAVEALRARHGHALSSHAFASLYLWREEMGLSLLLAPDWFTVRSAWRGENAWFFPCGPESAVEAFVREKSREADFSLCYLRASDAAWLRERFPGRWLLRRDPDADEYLYDAAGHRDLQGGAYANMRTQVHKVEREYAPRAEVLGDDNLGDALAIVRQWSHGHHRFEDCGLRDDCVDEEALLLRRELGITGVVLYLRGEPAAVTAGFALGEDVYDVAIAKSVCVEQGAPYYAKRELFRRLPGRWINMEEDLGIPGLRRMKNNLRPVGKNEIWEAIAP